MSISDCVELIKAELQKADKDFTGNIDFKVNFKDGSIGNINFGTNKVLK
jgi:copper chaperone CopZ